MVKHQLAFRLNNCSVGEDYVISVLTKIQSGDLSCSLFILFSPDNDSPASASYDITDSEIMLSVCVCSYVLGQN
jgi:hypothetical protein